MFRWVAKSLSNDDSLIGRHPVMMRSLAVDHPTLFESPCPLCEPSAFALLCHMYGLGVPVRSLIVSARHNVILGLVCEGGVCVSLGHFGRHALS